MDITIIYGMKPEKNTEDIIRCKISSQSSDETKDNE